MAVLEGLEPERVFYYFEEISKIPRGSYHEKAISDYLVRFAKERDFTVYQDDLYNVIMLVPASRGYEQEEPVIIQGHMDMVCEKKEGADIDMEKDGLTLMHDDRYVYAKDTTLGGDDGIAVAYMLAIAENDDIAHPPLEMVITVSEEVGMEGAKGIDVSMLKGHRMLNLDSEEEGIFLSSCAGGLSTHSKLPVSFRMSEPLIWYELSVSGLLGGHSGCEIHKGRANANRLLGRVLFELEKEVTFCVAGMEGGGKDNAIPLHAAAVIGMEDLEAAKAGAVIKRMRACIRAEYGKADPDIEITLQGIKMSAGGMEELEEAVVPSMHHEVNITPESRMVVEQPCLVNIITLLMTLPEGVQGMSMSVPGLVETSLNLGIMKLCKDHLFLQHAIRSSVTTKKHYVADQVERLVTELGGSVERKGEYPAWEYREKSVVRPRVIALYEKMYGKEPVVEGIHAGLECGLLAGKIKELDCVAMGPDILDIHTTAERLDIASTKRVYKFLLEYLKIKDE